jgi:hypothetical protein
MKKLMGGIHLLHQSSSDSRTHRASSADLTFSTYTLFLQLIDGEGHGRKRDLRSCEISLMVLPGFLIFPDSLDEMHLADGKIHFSRAFQRLFSTLRMERKVSTRMSLIFAKIRP